MLVTPDTSPRNTGAPDADKDWDFGHGAGFYLDAGAPAYARHWRMETWITQELPQVLAAHFPVQPDAVGILGHSMGDHGALTLALRHPGLYRSVSASRRSARRSTCRGGRRPLAAISATTARHGRSTMRRDSSPPGAACPTRWWTRAWPTRSSTASCGPSGWSKPAPPPASP